jgi:hypothetical protein
MNQINSALANVNDKINELEPYLSAQTKELDSKGMRWFQYDNKREKLLENGADKLLLSINVGGKKFYISLATVLNNPDTLFFNLIMTDQWNIKDELFFDRSYTYFQIIISYLRNGIVNLAEYKDEELPSIEREAKYYLVSPLVDMLQNCIC